MTIGHRERATRLARKHACEAVEALLDVMADPKASPPVRSRAASLILAAAGLVGITMPVSAGVEAIGRREDEAAE